MTDSRLYDERETSLILRRAAELQARDSQRPAAGALTRAEIESIAADAGIDAKYVTAALSTAVAPPRRGGLFRRGLVRGQHTLEQEFDEAAMSGLVDLVAAEFGRRGTTREVLGGVEWNARDPFGAIHLIIRRLGSQTRIEVSAERGELGLTLGMIGISSGLILGGIAGAVATGLGAIAAAPAIGAVAGLAVGIGSVRLLWERALDRWQRRIDRLIQRVAARQ